MCLAPRLQDPDEFLAKVESKKPFEFCIKIEELRMATLAIKLDLSSLEEVNMQIKHATSLSRDEVAYPKHLKVPFSVGVSL